MQKLLAAVLLSAGMSTAGLAPALAQEAVPLTYDLFDLVWHVVEYEGQTPDSYAPQIGFGETTAQGRMPCGGAWTATAAKDQLPRLQISDVAISQLAVPDCTDPVTEAAFVAALQAVTRVDTTPDGLGFFAADGRRVMLAVAGG